MKSDHEVPTWTYGDRLRKARESVGLDTRQMAERMGVTAGAISQWERGRRRPGDIVDVSRRWSDVTGIPVEWLLGLDRRSTCFSEIERRGAQRRQAAEVWSPARPRSTFDIAA